MPVAVNRLRLLCLVVIVSGCRVAGPSGATTSARAGPSGQPTPIATALATAAAWQFPTAEFADLGEGPVPESLASRLQDALASQASGDGLTAAVIAPQGAWSGATGRAAGDRAMVPTDQLSIAHITQALVAAQVMQLVEAGELALDDLAADHLPPGLAFDANGATVADLLGHRSGLPDTLSGPGQWASLRTEPLHAWTPEEELATVGAGRGVAGRDWEFVGTNYLVLNLILRQVTGRSVAEVLRRGILAGDGYERLIYQPDEQPSEPMAMPDGAAADTFDKLGRALPSLARVTAESAEANMASDASSLARWWRALCAGEVVSTSSVSEMTDFRKRPEFGLGIWDRRSEYGGDSGALGLVGVVEEGYRSVALCFRDPGVVVVVLANAADHDVDSVAGVLWRAAAGR